jgi:hypothetical protein
MLILLLPVLLARQVPLRLVVATTAALAIL